MWILASSHATHFPFIQIVFAFMIAMVSLDRLSGRLGRARPQGFANLWNDACDMAPDAAPAFFVGFPRRPERVAHREAGLARLGPLRQHVRMARIGPQPLDRARVLAL